MMKAPAHDGDDPGPPRATASHSAGLLRLIANLLHHGDGHHAGGGHVRNRGAGDHAHQTGGQNRRLRGAAGGLVGHLHAHVNEQLAAANGGEEGAEHDEVEQCAGRGKQRGSEHAALRHGHAGCKLVQELQHAGLGLCIENTGQIQGHPGVDDEHRDKHRQRQSQVR